MTYGVDSTPTPARRRVLLLVPIASEGKEPDGSTVLCAACVAHRIGIGDDGYDVLAPDARLILDGNPEVSTDVIDDCEDCNATAFDSYTDSERERLAMFRKAAAWDAMRERAPFEEG